MLDGLIIISFLVFLFSISWIGTKIQIKHNLAFDETKFKMKMQELKERGQL